VIERFKSLKLSPEQWKILSAAFSNIGQAVILFSAAAFFVPETVNLSKNFSRGIAFIFFLCGLILLIIAVILTKRSK